MMKLKSLDEYLGTLDEIKVPRYIKYRNYRHIGAKTSGKFKKEANISLFRLFKQLVGPAPIWPTNIDRQAVK